MEKLPEYVSILLDGFGERFDPSVKRTEMERGPVKQEVLNSQVMVEIEATLFFRGRADTVSFDSWYFDTIRRVGWFDVYDHRYRVTRSMRFKGGDIGTLTPLTGGFHYAQRTVTLEYLR
ncbi:hypothetical protein SBO82_17330 [Alcaligenes nematophilus]|uniref:hypothetical protein n=1 Tax=Alcaligenes nematophilus TaxID=2994643 RepID=UPI002467085F|nr:hypothetical protein [Alcaligenes nematophilus]MDH4868728.1 hypothetical protein [Bacillus cereus]MDY7130045.1 hypothetical protein [Alcaligenes nematophilus]